MHYITRCRKILANLKIAPTLLGTKLPKIGRVLNIRRLASSFRLASTIWNIYEVLVQHFEEAKFDNKQKCK